MSKIKRSLAKLLNRTGYTISRQKTSDPVIDLNEEFMSIFKKCQPFTMTSKERMYSLYQSILYILKAQIPGDFVECGVWRGGSSMLIALTLLEHGDTERSIYLYDTFEGMSEPTEEDYKLRSNNKASDKWKDSQKEDYNDWCYASLDEVRSNMYSTHYNKNKINFVKGKVEDTIPHDSPENICLLRLDTDWYESTLHELQNLYPILSQNGVLIIDDYGDWAGSKQAVDEYFQDIPILLNRVDYTGRVSLKTQ